MTQSPASCGERECSRKLRGKGRDVGLEIGTKVRLRNDYERFGEIHRRKNGHESRGGVWKVVYDEAASPTLDEYRGANFRVYDPETGTEKFLHAEWVSGDQLEIISD